MKVVLIEDEEPASDRLKNQLLQIDPELQIMDTLVSIQTSITWLQNNSPDLIFMDIHLADGLSFEIFKEVKISCPVIFTTAYDQYALQAFKVNSIDYLLKPVKKEDLQLALDKFNAWFKKNEKPAVDYQKLLDALEKGKADFQKRIIIRYGDIIKAVEIEDVAYFYTHEKIDYLKTKGGVEYPIDYHLDELEEILDSKIFFRINRQFIVNYSAIEKMVSFSKSRVKLILKPPSNHETIVSTERSPNFKQWLIGK